jgi:hypothetical protein
MGKHPGYGWVPDLLDNRDLLPGAPVSPVPLPSEVGLGGNYKPVYDQGQLGSCTGNVIAGALDFERLRQELPAHAPSRLFIYYLLQRERQGGAHRAKAPEFPHG